MNGPRHIVLTVDYEIFGNGQGDVRQHVVAPTARMAGLCEKYGVPLTVFFEVEEYLAFERNRQRLIDTLGYDPASLIRQQIISLAAAGHDIQLHLHPEWYRADFREGQWCLHREKATVDSLFESQEETTNYIAERKAVIEEMIANSSRQSEVTVYRAGAFSAQPGAKLLTALAENDFAIDSSVVKGLRYSQDTARLDYRKAPSAKEPWRVSHDVVQPDPRGPIWEVPIYSRMRRRFQQLTWRRLRAKFSRNIPKTQQQEMVRQLGFGRNPLAILKFLAQPVPIKLDFHNQSPRTLLSWIKSAPAPTNGGPDVVVLIGHTKEHTDDRAFETFLSLATGEPNLKVVGFSKIAQILKTRLNGHAKSSAAASLPLGTS